MVTEEDCGLCHAAGYYSCHCPHKGAPGVFLDGRPAPGQQQENSMETFIQPKITGYHQLNEVEVAVMNEGKALAEQCREFVAKLREFADQDAPPVKPDQRWVSIGATDLQTGFMALTRSIAKPTTF